MALCLPTEWRTARMKVSEHRLETRGGNMKQQLVRELAEELRRKRSALLLDGGNREIAPEVVDERESEIEESAQLDRITTVESHLEERDQKQLQEIEVALDRLDTGEYGECQECGEEIGAARLKVLPTATLCIDC